MIISDRIVLQERYVVLLLNENVGITKQGFVPKALSEIAQDWRSLARKEIRVQGGPHKVPRHPTSLRLNPVGVKAVSDGIFVYNFLYISDMGCW
mgnify:CR=1 FL=1